MAEELDYLPSKGNPRQKRGELFPDGTVRKYLRGDIRISDGFLFSTYVKQYRKRKGEYVMREIWASPKVFSNQLEAAKKRANQFRLENPEEHRKRKKASDTRCSARRIEYSRKWQENNREKSRAIKTKWRLANPDQTNKLAAKRRSRKRNAILMLHRGQENIITTIYDCSRRVSDCLNIPHEVDHIVPISRGGYHIHTNMQIIPMRINRSKSDKLPHELQPL